LKGFFQEKLKLSITTNAMVTAMNEETYLIGGIHYHSRFPREWADDHLDGSGPENCANCEYFGSLNGVFIGYCGNCADYVYNGERGRGIMETGVEFDRNGESMYDTYLSGLTLDIGATRLVAIDAPEAMTREEFTGYCADMANDWNSGECPVNPYSVNQEFLEDHIGDHYHEEVEENQEGVEDSVLECNFEGGYNDM